MSAAAGSASALERLAALAARRPAVVLDDDPTGTQTLRDVPVLTRWSASQIARHIDEPVVFLSTNSRSLDEADAVGLVHEATSAALAAARTRARPISLVSRSDSTLRGHFPAEPRAIAAAAGMADARFLLAPFFAEGGRTTTGDVHYLDRDGSRVPVGDTEFARDPVFGYSSSNLRAWVAEKYDAAGLPAPPLASLELELVRDGGAEAIAERLLAQPAGAVVVANAGSDADIEAVALGALLAEEAGLPLVARVAASYVRARAGRRPAPLLSRDELGSGGPGIVVVGSYVETTTRQLERLLREAEGVVAHELPLEPLLDGDERAIAAGAGTLSRALSDGRTGVVYTERSRRDVGLDGARAISAALVEIVRRVDPRPGWVLAKGGITSNDVAGGGLGMREARVVGQLLPGVPVWRALAGSRWPGLPLVVFPGNVGGPDALAECVARLTAGQ